MDNHYLQIIVPIIKKYIIELTLICLSIIIALFSLSLYIKSSEEKPLDEEVDVISKPISSNVYVDISGAIEKPDMYQLRAGSRLKDLITKAGGLSQSADKNFFGRNFNLSQIINDQDKIYIPSYYEVNLGVYVESSHTVDSVKIPASQPLPLNETSQIDINNASVEELDTLPGIGKVTAQKIVQNRPYTSLEDLKNKKVLKSNVLDTIRDIVTF